MISKIGTKNDEDKSSLGGKGYNLNKLKQAGFSIPEGYLITTKAFDEFIDYNKINYSSKDFLDFNVEIQEKLLSGKLPPEFQTILVGIFNEMKNSGIDRFIVRSSAICEDGEEYSMAGMFESYTNLLGYEEIEEAVKKCYASLFSDRVLDFLFKYEIGFDNLKMALVLQEYLPGEISGVTFTADTIEMDSNTICISAANGQCATFVSGQASSQVYKVNKTTKDFSVENGAENILTKTMVNKMLDVFLNIESVMGNFQDIEWTIIKEKLYVLQARAITTFKTKDFPVVWHNPEDEKYTWHLWWYDDALSPLMQDIIGIELKSVSKGSERSVMRLDTYTETKVVNGYYYARIKELPDKDEKRNAFIDEVNNLFSKGKNIYDHTILPELLNIINKMNKFREGKLTNKEVKEYLQLSLEYLDFSWSNHWPATHGNMYIDTFNEYVKKILPSIDTENYYDLIYGESILAKERRYLIEMSEMVKGNEVISNLFKECSCDVIVYERLKKLEGAKALIAAIKKYQSEYGECDAGMDSVLHAVLGERPDYVIGSIKDMLKVESKTFYASLSATKDNKQRLIAEIESKLSGNDLIEFRNKLKIAELSFLTNDNHNYYMERMYRGYLWLAVKEASSILLNEKVISKLEDINYLQLHEIKELLIAPSSMMELVSERKELHKKQKKICPPEILGTISAENNEENITNNDTVENKDKVIIKAISGLNKKITGKIVHGIPENPEENCIILLPHPHYDGLSKVLSKVKGLIFNWGSPYDHLGIIAREMGIPAMYNAFTALDLLKDGDMVELDGVHGEIILISSSATLPQ